MYSFRIPSKIKKKPRPMFLILLAVYEKNPTWNSETFFDPSFTPLLSKYHYNRLCISRYIM